jgi:glutathione S-transferase
LDYFEPICGKHQFLVSDNLTTADFWVGSLYTNYFVNPNICFAKDRWAPILDKYPNWKAYGDRFVAANDSWMQKRPVCPI